MGNEESGHSGEEGVHDDSQPQLQRTNSARSRSSYKNNVYAEIYDSAVSTVNEAASSLAQLEPVSQGIDLLSEAANAVSDIAGQASEVVTTAFDDLMQDTLDGDDAENQKAEQRRRTAQATLHGEEPPVEGGTPEHHEGAPVQRNTSQSHLKSRSGYKNSVYTSIYESASETFNEAVSVVSQLASEGVEAVSSTFDELLEESPEAKEVKEGEEKKKSSGSSNSEGGEDVFQFVSGLISTGVAEVANQIDYDSISHTILKAVQDINEVLGVEHEELSSDEQVPLTNANDAVHHDKEDDLMELPENPYATATVASLEEGNTDSLVIESAPPAGVITREEEQTID